MHQGRLGLGIRLEGRRREDHARDDGTALREIADHAVEVGEAAENRNAAYRLPLIGRRRRQHADRPDLANGAALDGAQQDLGVGRAAKHERRIGRFGQRVMTRAGIAEIAIGDARAAQEDVLEDPVQRDRDFAEKELPEHVGRDQDIVEHQKRNGQHRRRAQDVHQVRKRGKAPLRFVQMEQIIDDPGVGDEPGQEEQQRIAPIRQSDGLEPDIEARDNRRRRHEQIMSDDERPARAQIQSEHA